jgi:hypothetical protein
VLRVDVNSLPAEFLYLGDDLQSECGFSGRFRAVNLGHAPAGNSADAKNLVDFGCARGHYFDFESGRAPEGNYRAFAVQFLNGCDCLLKLFLNGEASR